MLIASGSHTMGRLGQETDAALEEQVLASLKELQRQEASLRQRYIELTAWVNMGGVPGVVVRQYSEAAMTMNKQLARTLQMFEDVGVVGAYTPIPLVHANRSYTDDEVLTTNDLSFEPCPERPVTLGWVNFLIEGVIVVAGIVIAAPYITKLVSTWKGSDVAISRFNQYIEVTKQQTDQLFAQHKLFSEQMALCAASGKTRDECVKQVTAILNNARAGLPKPTDKGIGGGLGFFGWIGVVVFVGGIGAIGYAIWRRRHGQNAAQVTKESEESALRREARMPGE